MLSTTVIFLKDTSPFCGATNTPILYFWCCLLWVSNPSLACFLACVILGLPSGATPSYCREISILVDHVICYKTKIRSVAISYSTKLSIASFTIRRISRGFDSELLSNFCIPFNKSEIIYRGIPNYDYKKGKITFIRTARIENGADQVRAKYEMFTLIFNGGPTQVLLPFRETRKLHF